MKALTRCMELIAAVTPTQLFSLQTQNIYLNPVEIAFLFFFQNEIFIWLNVMTSFVYKNSALCWQAKAPWQVHHVGFCENKLMQLHQTYLEFHTTIGSTALCI